MPYPRVGATNLGPAMLLCILASLLSCNRETSGREGNAFEPAGHLVLGDRSARYWGLAAGVHYPEFARSRLPGEVASSVDSWVAGYRYDAKCTRYFRAQALFLVAASVACAESSAQPERFQLVAFDSAGGAVRVAITNSWDNAITMTSSQGAPAIAP